MGAWDYMVFGSGDARGWASELRSHDDLSFIEQTLVRAIAGTEWNVRAPKASQAIAAAEVVARLQGHCSIRSPETKSVDKWVLLHPLPVPTRLAQIAHVAIDRILTRPSELLDLWEESDGFDAWKGALTDLKTRIHV